MLATKMCFASRTRAPGVRVHCTASPTTNGTVIKQGAFVTPDRHSTTKLRLLQSASAYDRGALASATAKTFIGDIIADLETAHQPPVNSDELWTKLDGRWVLVYTNVEPFRSSPFFWAFQEGLVSNRAIASAIFKFTDSIPGARVGEAFQTFSLANSRLLSEVKLDVFPGVNGFVVTDSRVAGVDPAAGTITVTVESTRVAQTNFFQFLEVVTVPVEQLIGAVRGAGATTVSATISYLDEDTRIMRTDDGSVFVYCKA